jgi:hypothetical protein
MISPTVCGIFLSHDTQESRRLLREHAPTFLEDNTNMFKGQVQVVIQLETEKWRVE